MGSTSPVTVQTTMNYYVTPDNGGTKDIYPGTASNYRRVYDVQPVTVTDLRSLAEPPSLDTQGFQLVQHTCSEKDWTDAAQIKAVAYKETAELLKKVTGASKVHVVSHLARRQSWETAIDATKHLAELDHVPLKSYATNRYVHVDNSYEGAQALLKEELPSPEEAARLSKTRWGIINVWRPINQTVRREPLAVCDTRTVADADLHQVTLHIAQSEKLGLKDVSSSGTFLTWAVTANPAHRWYYAKELVPEEVLMIKIYDSEAVDGAVRGTPHSAFVTDGDEGPARESVEMRCLVFWENQ